MKNFRKTIIALATVAAMLVPSVAMAATLTTTVDKDITGDVYVGFYDGAVLKDVVKTTVDDITVSDAETAGTEETMPTVKIENTKVRDRASDNAAVYKIVVKAQTPAGVDPVNSTGIMFSYDNTVVQPVRTTTAAPDVDVNDKPANCVKNDSKTMYEDPEDPDTMYKVGLTLAPIAVSTIGNRTAMLVESYAANPDDENSFCDLSSEKMIYEFYYRVKDGKEVTKGTFVMEKDASAGSFQAAIGNPGDTKAVVIGTEYWYGRVKGGEAQADTIAYTDFPWNLVQEPTTKDLTVTVPEGAEGYTATMFIWDADQIAQCAPITTFTKN